MKKKFRAILIAGGLTIMVAQPSTAQLKDLGLMLSGGVNDAQLIMNNYLTPLANSLGANLNAGWYNSAKTHDLLGFHLNFTVSAAFVPDAAKLYDLDGLMLEAGYTDNNAPTFSGETGLGPTLSYTTNVNGNDVTLAEYPHPGGSGLGWFPSPMINAGFGLPKGFEIQGRYMPDVKYKGSSAGLWGIGLKHDLKQWIPGVKRIPAFQLALHYGYTNLKFKQDLKTVTPITIGADDQTSNVEWDGQNLNMNTTAHTASLLVGANVPVVAFYGGVGISITKTQMKLNGNFPVPTVDPGTLTTVVTDDSYEEDPFDIEIKNTDGGTTKPRLNAGIRFKFSVITLHFDYTYANYSVATAGLGISFR